MTNIDDGSYTCLCAEPIPPNGTYSFKAEYSFTGNQGGHIGVAWGDKNLNESINGLGAWGVSQRGAVILDSEFQPDYFPYPFYSGSNVTVNVNISEGWI